MCRQLLLLLLNSVDQFRIIWQKLYFLGSWHFKEIVQSFNKRFSNNEGPLFVLPNKVLLGLRNLIANQIRMTVNSVYCQLATVVAKTLHKNETFDLPPPPFVSILCFALINGPIFKRFTMKTRAEKTSIRNPRRKQHLKIQVCQQLR